VAPYRDLLGDEVYRRVFANTAFYAVIVTLIDLVLGYPVAFGLARLRPPWRGLLFACVLLPLWVSVLVRSFAWMLILERNGPVNDVIAWLGLPRQRLLFDSTGVLIAMTHLLLPYAVLPIFAAIVRVDFSLIRASLSLGAGHLRTFLTILLPLSLGGVGTAATFVFLLSLGFFITPALLGGPSDITLSMLIDSFVEERLDWPLASAAAMILLVAASVVIYIASRFGQLSLVASSK